jgi:hypothetical protein
LLVILFFSGHVSGIQSIRQLGFPAPRNFRRVSKV